MSEPIQQDPVYQQMAHLLNYDAKGLQPVDGEASAPDAEAQYYHPEDDPTPRRFSQRGLTKLGFVAAAMAFVFFILGIIVTQIFSSRPSTQTETPPETYQEQDQLTLSLDPPESSEVGSLRTEVAMQQQAQQLDAMLTELQAIDQQAQEPAPAEPAAAEPDTSAPAAPSPVARPAPAPTPAARPVSAPEPPTPWEQWVAISNAGTLGVVSPEVPRRSPAFSPPTANRPSSRPGGPVITRRPNAPTQPGSGAPTLAANPQPAPAASGLGVYLTGREPTPGMRHRTRRTVAIGTTANAVIATPVLWPGDGSAIQNSRDPSTPKYVVTLEDPLQSADGQTVFPEAAKLVVTVAPMDAQSGVATLDVLSIIREADGQAFAIPPGQLMIRGENGEPLRAQRLNDLGGSILSMDLGLFAVSALAEVGQLMNRPDSQTINNSLFQGSVSTTYGDRNYLGAVLEGGSGAIAERMADRNDQAIDALAAQPQTWYLPQGARVQLFVNQTMQIP